MREPVPFYRGTGRSSNFLPLAFAPLRLSSVVGFSSADFPPLHGVHLSLWRPALSLLFASHPSFLWRVTIPRAGLA